MHSSHKHQETTYMLTTDLFMCSKLLNIEYLKVSDGGLLNYRRLPQYGGLRQLGRPCDGN